MCSVLRLNRKIVLQIIISHSGHFESFSVQLHTLLCHTFHATNITQGCTMLPTAQPGNSVSQINYPGRNRKITGKRNRQLIYYMHGEVSMW